MRTTLRTALLSCAAICLTSTAYAADLVLVDPPMYSPTPAANWEGFYAGVQLGFASGFADHLANPPNNDLTLGGGLLGGKIGYNMYLADQFVGGIEADFSAANITGADTALPNDPTHTINWLGSVRGRLGYDAGQFMPYVTGGVAFAQATRTTELGAPNSATASHVGWTVGAGLEYMVAPNWAVKGEYMYYDFGTTRFTTPVALAPFGSFRTDDHTLKLGINYRFNFASPVVANY